MRKATKRWLITAAALVLIGLVTFAAVMSAYGWDFARLGTVKYEDNNYVLSEEFTHISICTDEADILLVLSEDGVCRVSCSTRRGFPTS